MTAALARDFNDYRGIVDAFGGACRADNQNDVDWTQAVLDTVANSDAARESSTDHLTLERLHPEDPRAKLAAFLRADPEEALDMAADLLDPDVLSKLSPDHLTKLGQSIEMLKHQITADQFEHLEKMAKLAGLELPELAYTPPAPTNTLSAPAPAFNMPFAA